MQLFKLDDDREEQVNRLADYPDKVASLLRLLEQQVSQGRCTPGDPVSNDRDVSFLPDGVTMPPRN
jgi:arylsulfatase A